MMLPKNLPADISQIKDTRTLAAVREEKAKVRAQQEQINARGAAVQAQRESQFEQENKELFAKKFFTGISNTMRQGFRMPQRIGFIGCNIPHGRIYFKKQIESDATEDEAAYGTVLPVVRKEIRYRLIPFYQLIFHLFP